MQITNYFDSDDKAHWLDEIGRCEWAGMSIRRAFLI